MKDRRANGTSAAGTLRPIKILLPGDVLHLVDQCIVDGVGGYANRHELARDALENFALELLYANEETTTASAPVRSTNGARADVARASDAELSPASVSSALPSITDIAETAISAAAPVAVADELAALRDEPLLGLHNRDWPSLWALGEIAQQTESGPRPLQDVYEETAARATDLALRLLPLERALSTKLTALLPSNPNKPQSAAEGFKAFALGSVSRKPKENGRYDVSGPLYLWRALGLVAGENGPLVGVSSVGRELLKVAAGLTVGTPHDAAKAQAFFSFLQRHAPQDWWGFQTMLEAVSISPSRVELSEHFAAKRAWSESVGSSTAQGYLARGREWGLVASKLVDGRYTLTELGEAMLSQPQRPAVSRKTRRKPKRRPTGARR